MHSDWQTLFAPRPLTKRALRLPLEGLAAPVWFATTGSADLMDLPAENFLTPAERTRASAFKFGQPRENFTLGRLAAKASLMAHAGEGGMPGASRFLATERGQRGELARQLHSFELGNGERGEPVVLAPADCGADVSLSHVNGRAVAVAFERGRQVGLDLEIIDAQRAETVQKAVPLSPAELAWLKGAPLPEPAAWLLLWTAREALGKALGCGLVCSWETLALETIEPAGEGAWSGRFRHHPQFRCWSCLGAGQVLSFAARVEEDAR